VVAVSVLGIVVPFLLGLAIGPWLHRHFAPQVDRLGFQFFVCIALSISALPIMGRILLEMGLERTALGAVAISAAALDDVVGWVLLAVATALVTAKFSWLSLGVQLGGIACFLAALRVAVGPALRGFWQRSVKHGEHGIPGTYLAVLLIVLFACCLTTNLLGIFSIFGAFLLGVSIHQEVLLVKRWRRKFSDFVLVALVPVFFTNTGLRTEVGALQSLQAWVACGLVLLAAIGGKLGGCWLAARYGQGSREAVCVAALMNTRALMGLVAINIGADLGLLPKQLFTMFVIMALVTTAMTGPILHFALPDDLKALAAKRERDEAEA
jgi:Kef-type K+ transport system membrane component KefB